MTTRRRKRRSPEQIATKHRDADAMLNSGKDLAVVLQTLEISEATYHRWRNQYGGMKSDEAKRLKQLEEENRRLRRSWPRRNSTTGCFVTLWKKTGEPFAETDCGQRASEFV